MLNYRKRMEGVTTDVLVWLNENGPRNKTELKELRKALYTRDTRPGYTVVLSGYDDDRFKITGRASSLLVLSDKARHFLLRTLCKINGTCPRQRRRR